MSGYHDKFLGSLQDRPIKIIGLGGIGSPVSLYVSKFLYSLNLDSTVFLIDGDEYEHDNRDRVAFHDYGLKAVVKETEMAGLYGDQVAFRAVPAYVTEENIAELLGNRDVIFLCVDNHSARRLVSEFCEGLDDVLLISGGNDSVDETSKGTFGNVQIFWREKGRHKTNPLTRYHSEIAQPQDHSPGSSEHQGCAMAVATGAQLAFTNLAVASEMLNSFMAWSVEELAYEELYLNLLQAKRVPISRKVAAQDHS
jgi:hypothetical protein